jgi:phage portal protein BeeE
MKTHTRIYGSDEEADAHLERARYQFMHMMQGGNAVAHKQRERKQEDTRALVWRDSSKLVLDAPADYEPCKENSVV